MSVIGTINREAAKFAPETTFDAPHEVVDEPMLTRGEKLATLKRWREQLLGQMSAADDGMPTQRSSDKTVRTIEDIDRCIERLSDLETSQG